MCGSSALLCTHQLCKMHLCDEIEEERRSFWQNNLKVSASSSSITETRTTRAEWKKVKMESFFDASRVVFLLLWLSIPEQMEMNAQISTLISAYLALLCSVPEGSSKPDVSGYLADTLTITVTLKILKKLERYFLCSTACKKGYEICQLSMLCKHKVSPQV